MIQREADDLTRMTITAGYAQGLGDAELRSVIEHARSAAASDPAVGENLAILLDELAQRQLSTAAMPQGDIDPSSVFFHAYQKSATELSSLGRQPSNDLEVAVIPAGQVLVVDENGVVSTVDPTSLALVGEDLLPVLDGLADLTEGGGALPASAMGSGEQQLVMWPDGRTLITSAASHGAASLVLNGRPVETTGFASVGTTGRPWGRVRDAAVSGVFRSGLYQLGTYPVSKFMGVNLPTGARIRFANPTWPNQWKFKPGLPKDTRLFEVFEPATNRFFAWDAHVTPPGSTTPHPFYHVNQKGMHPLFGKSNISPIAAADIGTARGLRYARIGGRIFLVVGVAADAYALGDAFSESIEKGTPRPVLAQAVRVAGSWGGAWAGAKLMCAGGALATAETGPGAVLGCVVGGAVGGFAGYFGADWIADMISPD